jgi:hypothetical protein
MGNSILALPDWSDGSGSALVASSEDSNFPYENLTNYQPTEFWRSANLSTTTITVNRGSSKPINFVSLLYTNFTVSATWQIELSDSPLFPASPDAAFKYDSGAIIAVASPSLSEIRANNRHCFKQISTANTNLGLEGYTLGGAGGLAGQYLRITLSDATNPDGYFQAGRFYGSQAWQLDLNIAFGSSLMGRVDPSVRQETPGGQTVIRAIPARDSVEMIIGQLDDTQVWRNMDLFHRMATANGSRDVLAVLDPDHATHAERTVLYGMIGQRLAAQHVGFDLHEERITLEALI